MISGRVDEILAHIDNGYVPGLFMAAYQVTTESGSFPHITRDNTHDIPANNIDMTSIHFEASQTPGTNFEPGGVIPAHLKFDILNYSSLSYTITPKKYVTSTSELDYVYRMVIVYNNTNYLYGPFFAATFLKRRYGQKTNIEFDDVLYILENRNCDVAGMSSQSLNSVASLIMQDAGFNAFYNNEIYPGANYYNENQINARQGISQILRINGLFLRPYTYGAGLTNWSYVAALLIDKHASLNLTRNYVFSFDYETESGTWLNSWVFEKGTDHVVPSSETFCIDDSPFIAQGNRYSYETLLNIRICGEYRQGYSFTIPMMPVFELGDYIRINYEYEPGSYTYRDMIVSRIEWDGGMFMKITEASFEGNR